MLLTTVKAMAPFTPFFTEGMYQNLRLALPDAEESVHYCSFPEVENEVSSRTQYFVVQRPPDACCTFLG